MVRSRLILFHFQCFCVSSNSSSSCLWFSSIRRLKLWRIQKIYWHIVTHKTSHFAPILLTSYPSEHNRYKIFSSHRCFLVIGSNHLIIRKFVRVTIYLVFWCLISDPVSRTFHPSTRIPSPKRLFSQNCCLTCQTLIFKDTNSV